MREINNHRITSSNDHSLKNNTSYDSYGKKPNNLGKHTTLKLLSIFLVLLISAIFIFLSRKKIEDTSPFVIQHSNPSDTSPNNMDSTLPVENGIYLTGDRSLFYINSNTKKYFEDKVVKSNDYRGNLARLDESTGKYNIWESYDFRDLKEPKLIYTSTSTQLYEINSSRIDSGGSYIYISGIFSSEKEEDKNLDPNTEINNKIIQINTSKDTVKEIWSNYLGAGSRYGSAVEGSAYIKEVVENNYLVLDIFGCYGCEGGPTNTIVLNINTGKEKFYEGVIDEIRFDIEKNTISYKKTQRVKQDCDSGVVCVPGLETTGEVIKDILP